YNATDDLPLLKENDYIIGMYEMNTMNTLLIFTNLGNYLYVPVYELPDLKWKEIGKHISNIVKLKEEESIIKSLPVYEFNQDIITIFTKNGMVKRTKIEEFKATRYFKPITCIKLKNDDNIIAVTKKNNNEVFITTKNGYGLRYNIKEIPITGLKTSGVKAINLKNDTVINGDIFTNTDYITIITDKGTGKRIKLTEFEQTSRARKGVLLVRDVKTNPYHILKSFIVNNKNSIGLKTKNNIKEIKITELPIVDRYKTGSIITKEKLMDTFIVTQLTNNKETNNNSEKETLEPLDTINEQIMTIDDFLDDFEG
ncbi:MAG: DNA gyrase C-terminal beta-propeller domain-containing protein, partial [Bacilli bacterium]